jgi:hypothetical protein
LRRTDGPRIFAIARAQQRLQRGAAGQLDDLAVREQVDEKRLDRGEIVGTAEVEKDDRGIG